MPVAWSVKVCPSNFELLGNCNPPSALNVQADGLVPVLATIVTSVPVPPPLIIGVSAGNVNIPLVPNVQVLVVAFVTVSM